MSEMVKYFNGEAERALQRARIMSDAADTEGRVLTDDEKSTVEEALKAAEDYRAKAAQARKDAEIRQTLEALGSTIVESTDDTKPARTIGDAFVASDGFKALQAKSKAGVLGRFTTDPVKVTREQVKATASPVLFADAGSGIVDTQGPLSEGDQVRTRLVIASLLSSIPVTSGNSVTYPVVKDRDDYDGSAVSEGASKAEVKYEFDDDTKTLFKLAVFTKMSSELIEDAPAIAAYINADIPLQVQAAEDAYLWGELTDAASAVSNAGDNTVDAIINAIAELAEAGFTADAVVMSPTELAAIKTLKAESGDGQYLLPPDLGVRIVVSAAADQILVGDFARGAKVYRKGGLSVESTNANEDDFIHNLVTIRAEQREVLGVTYPQAFLTVANDS